MKNQACVLAVVMALGTAGSVWAADGIRFGMVGLAAFQTARLNVVNTYQDPNLAPCRLQLSFFYSEGTPMEAVL